MLQDLSVSLSVRMCLEKYISKDIFPLNIFYVANNEGLKIYKMEDDVFGVRSIIYNRYAFLFNVNNKKCIFLNSNSASRDILYLSIAHELGRFLFGFKALNEQNILSEDQYIEEEEKCNMFAYSLIMPEKIFKEIYYKSLNVKDLQIFFGVSEYMVYERMIQLSITKYNNEDDIKE